MSDSDPLLELLRRVRPIEPPADRELHAVETLLRRVRPVAPPAAAPASWWPELAALSLIAASFFLYALLGSWCFNGDVRTVTEPATTASAFPQTTPLRRQRVPESLASFSSRQEYLHVRSY